MTAKTSSFSAKRAVILLLLAPWISLAASAEKTESEPLSDPAAHAFPLLGVGAEREVEVAWNRVHDYAGLEAIL